jgi:hypothetical protein
MEFTFEGSKRILPRSRPASAKRSFMNEARARFPVRTWTSPLGLAFNSIGVVG